MKTETLEERVARSFPSSWLSIPQCDEIAELAVSTIRETHRIEPKGTPIKPEDVREGDLVRIEFADGDVVKRTALGPYSPHLKASFYLLDRLGPDADFVFPTRNGAAVRLTPNNGGELDRTIASLEGGCWFVAGFTGGCSEEKLRDGHHDFELLSNGSAANE